MNDESEQTAYPEAQQCPVCGEYHPECEANLLGAMHLWSWSAARKVLSEEGVETLRMIESAAEHLGVREAYVQARATVGLTDEERAAIEIFLARLTLIDSFQRERGVYVSGARLEGLDEN